jgi:hypothetical protein
MMGPIGNPETSVQNYHSVLHKFPQNADSLTLQQMPESTQRYVIYLFCFLQYLNQGQFMFWVLHPSGKYKQKLSKLAHVMMLLTCVQEIPGMGLSCDTNSADCFLWFC